nr:efflux RND transporter periplasmic adaptor subunit [Saprospiraceae bacterium]
MRLLLFFLITLSFLLLNSSCGGGGDRSGSAATNQGPRVSNVKGVVVDTFEVANEVITPGTFEAFEQLNITPEVAGLIKKINFTEGSTVRRGQLLISMDDRELAGELKKLQLEISLAEDERKRAERLIEIQAISDEELQRSINREATLRAEKELLEVRKSKLNVYAPFNGQIGLQYISEGNYVSPGARIATLHQLHPLKLDFEIPETYIDQIGVGSEVSFTTVGKSVGKRAEIYAVEPGVNPQTRTMRVRAKVDNQNGDLLPGRFAQVILRVDVNPNAVMVPSEAVIPVIEGQMVFVSRNGKAESIQIKTGIRTDRTVEILEGLNPGDTVITTGLMSLAEGASLEVELVDFSHHNNL